MIVTIFTYFLPFSNRFQLNLIKARFFQSYLVQKSIFKESLLKWCSKWFHKNFTTMKKFYAPKYFELSFIMPPVRINKFISRVCFKSFKVLDHIDSIAQFFVYFLTNIASQTQSFFLGWISNQINILNKTAKFPFSFTLDV